MDIEKRIMKYNAKVEELTARMMMDVGPDIVEGVEITIEKCKIGYGKNKFYVTTKTKLTI